MEGDTFYNIFMKKILIICHTFSSGGGAEKVLSSFLQILNKSYKIDIIERLEGSIHMSNMLPSNVTKLKSMSYSNERLKELHFSVRLGEIWRLLLSILIILYPRFVYKFFIKSKYDYEISFNYLYSSALIANSPNTNSYKIMWIHGSIDDLVYLKYSGVKRLKFYTLYYMQKQAFKKADKIIAISKNTFNSILELYPYFTKKTEIIYNGYNIMKFWVKSAAFKVPASSLGRIRLISIGRLDENKNIELQIDSLIYMLDNNLLDVELYIIGTGPLESYLKKISSKYLNQNIFFLGYVDNPYPYLKSADIFLLTSKSEGFPTVVVEALALGIPVVCTKVGGVEELLYDAINGYVVNSDIYSISSSVLRLANKRCQNEVVKKTVQSYTLENWYNHISKILNENERI